MLRLPALSFGGGSWLLPLAPASAEALVEVLLLDRVEDRTARLAQAIERDPGLALWAYCLASLDGVRDLHKAAELADWLAESAIELLDGLQADRAADETYRSLLLRAAHAWQASPLPDWLRHAIGANSQQYDDKVESSLAERILPALVGKLARLQRLETAFNGQLETEKLEAMAEFAAGAGHEINNPIAVIAGRAQLFLREERDPERRRELAVMNVQAMRVYEMIADMMLFARPPAPKRADCDLSQLLDKLLGELQPQAAERRIELCRDGEREPIIVRADIDQLSAAIRALVENAIEAMPGGGQVRIHLARVLSSNGAADVSSQAIEIIIRDNGPGIPPEVRRHLFDPFFSGRGAGRGLGLGLSKCWRIVTNHGGRVEVASEAGAGATFTIRLPGASRKSEGGSRNEE